MNKIFFFCMLAFLPILINAQNEEKFYNALSDSIAIESRTKADIVLESLSSKSGEKLLFSLSDRNFYVIVKDDVCFQEFYILLDSLNSILETRVLTTKRKYMKLIKEAFELDKYHSDLVTKIPNATYVRGELSYFVVKDTEGNRYGEFSLSSLTLPNPIDGELYGYLLRRLTEESSNNN